MKIKIDCDHLYRYTDISHVKSGFLPMAVGEKIHEVKAKTSIVTQCFIAETFWLCSNSVAADTTPLPSA